jgi:hypothetical protein
MALGSWSVQKGQASLTDSERQASYFGVTW